MKKRIHYFLKLCLEYQFFLGLLLLSDLVFAFFLWLLDAKSFFIIIGLFASLTVILFIAAVLFIQKRERKRQNAVQNFLENPDLQSELYTFHLLSVREGQQLRTIGKRIREYEEALAKEQQQRQEYEEYIEAWAHEIKVPLSLMTLLLDNRKEEMSPLVYQRMAYAGGQMQECVTQILYFARLKAVHKDYLFERLSLRECLDEVVHTYAPFGLEEEVSITLNVSDTLVVTDKKGIFFMLEQIIANAFKYKDIEKTEQKIVIYDEKDKEGKHIWLTIKDNGIGVKASDLPFLFDKGFTGDTDERMKKATGMGLYLVKQMAQNLNVELKVESEYGKGFQLMIGFPVVD